MGMRRVVTSSTSIQLKKLDNFRTRILTRSTWVFPIKIGTDLDGYAWGFIAMPTLN